MMMMLWLYCSLVVLVWEPGLSMAWVRRIKISLDRCHEPPAQLRGKLANWGNAFLPGAYTGTYVNIHECSLIASQRSEEPAAIRN